MVIKYFKRRKKIILIRLVIGLSLIGLAAGLFYYFRLNELVSLANVINWVENARHNNGTIIFFYCGFVLGVMAAPISIFPIIGGVLLPFWLALPLNLAAATTGAGIAFLVARFFGREAIEPFLKGKFRSFDKSAATQGVGAVFVLRWVGIPPFVIANYLLGLSRIKLRDFLLGTVAGILPWTTFVTYSAGSLWEAVLVGGEKGLRQAIVSKMGPLMVLSCIVLVSVGITAYIKSRKKVVLSAAPQSNL
jgi:uncharacterized membrane protein YdjX (TVP38/TMEM64 family)